MRLLSTDAAYRSLLVEQCAIIVAEDSMKWAAIHPEPGAYNFGQADALLAFAAQNRMAVRGHNLCWHEALPSWFASTITPANAAEVLGSHIRAVAGRYKGRIRAWDVVNEAVLPEDGREDGLRDSPWLRMLGPGYLDLAFRAARKADPHALLTYNEYGLEDDKPASMAKRAAVLALVRRMVAEKTPIDAVGIQSHLDIQFDIRPDTRSHTPSGTTTGARWDGILQFSRDLRALGLQVFVTELDVNDDNVAKDDPATRDAAVAHVYQEYVTAMVADGGASDVLTWGLSDNHTWLNGSPWHRQKHPGRTERALPFDATYHPKAAFYALRAGLDEQKH